MKPRKVPLRSCIGCQEQKNKRELVRIVRTPEGNVELDSTGKKAGRGAYLCRCRSCLDKAVKGKRIERSLKHPVSPAVIQDLAKQLPGDDENAT
ncbi:MAG: YlxR family protein [Bacillota bacterium]|nr:YlxR family protein [Bacillota bacterium]MDW7682535.1 YlxR family protein [Bacillota bacterium]